MDVMRNFSTISNVYSVYAPPPFIREKRVYCDMKTEGGGWTVCTSVNTRLVYKKYYTIS